MASGALSPRPEAVEAERFPGCGCCWRAVGGGPDAVYTPPGTVEGRVTAGPRQGAHPGSGRDEQSGSGEALGPLCAGHARASCARPPTLSRRGRELRPQARA